MTPEDEKPRGPRRSAKGKKKAEEKFARQAAALRANLKRRHQQRRGQGDDAETESDPDSE